MSTIERCNGCGARHAGVSEQLEVSGFVVKRCAICGTTCTDPLPSEEVLARFYASYSDGYSAGMSSARYGREMPKRWKARLARIAALGGRGALLDLGGANGLFGRLAHEAGFRVSIVDFVPEKIELGFTTVIPGDLSRPGGVPFGDGLFDVVTLWSCVEHVRHPEAAFAEAFRLVRPGGLVAIDTPLIGDICERLFPARSHWIAPPEHLTVFSESGLRAAAERTGLTVLLHEPFHERSRARWLARRARNAAVASRGALLRFAAPERWKRAREDASTSAGDIQVLIARRP